MLVLVIEDSRTQAERLRLTLTAVGHSVEIATSGESAIERCAAAPLPDAVLSDVLMPGIDGFETCRRLRALPNFESVPILLLTTLERPSDVLRALAAGATHFMTKPYSDERLLHRLAQAVARSSDASDSAVELQGEIFRLDVSRGRLIQVLGACLEDAIRRNEEIEANRDALQRAQQQREEMIRIVAHELRTPLSSLLLRADLARKEADRALLEAMPDAVSDQVHRMVRLIDDLVDVAALDLGTLEIVREHADLAAVVRAAVERLAPMCASHVVHVTTPDTLPAFIDPGRIEQVITNLLTNAVKYSSQGASIDVTLEALDGGACVSVRDQGIGIEPEAQEQVFERQFRTARGAESAAGSGLGLFLCKRLVELHDGRVTVRSVVDEGTEMSFRIPIGTPS